ncbi:hypothetical protein CU044_4578 [Streptomyces sp. L-9-10]|nr:hypothetical protein CU044_4578 [Streptomyces sp. L-9-10]
MPARPSVFRSAHRRPRPALSSAPPGLPVAAHPPESAQKANTACCDKGQPIRSFGT